jgi:hypothetical protein
MAFGKSMRRSVIAQGVPKDPVDSVISHGVPQGHRSFPKAQSLARAQCYGQRPSTIVKDPVRWARARAKRNGPMRWVRSRGLLLERVALIKGQGQNQVPGRSVNSPVFLVRALGIP